jgi:SAM-dependent methyltransferase
VPRVPPGGHALDLCCGTGVAAAALAARGFRVTGVDVSEGMLAHARRRAPGARFVAADLRRFVLPAGAAPGPADAAVCLGEGLNHLLTPGDLARAVRRVAAALRPGAAFVFDVVEESRFRAHWWGQQYTTVEADRAFAARGRYAPDTRLAHMHLEFAWREGDGAGGWRETERDLYQRCHTRDELDDALRGAGFAPDAVAYHDAARDLGLADHAGRVFVVATRSAAPVRRGAPARAAAGRRGAGPACGAPA